MIIRTRNITVLSIALMIREETGLLLIHISVTAFRILKPSQVILMWFIFRGRIFSNQLMPVLHGTSWHLRTSRLIAQCLDARWVFVNLIQTFFMFYLLLADSKTLYQ